jgi:hypothetical protein
MSDQFFERASDSFYDRVEVALSTMGQPPQLSREECEIVDDFAALDFGVDPCAYYIAKERAKGPTNRGNTRRSASLQDFKIVGIVRDGPPSADSRQRPFGLAGSGNSPRASNVDTFGSNTTGTRHGAGKVSALPQV